MKYAKASVKTRSRRDESGEEKSIRLDNGLCSAKRRFGKT
jgi:hypothetical protein